MPLAGDVWPYERNALARQVGAWVDSVLVYLRFVRPQSLGEIDSISNRDWRESSLIVRAQDGEAGLREDGFRRQTILRTCQICGHEDQIHHVEKMREIPAANEPLRRRGFPRVSSRPSSAASDYPFHSSFLTSQTERPGGGSALFY